MSCEINNLLQIPKKTLFIRKDSFSYNFIYLYRKDTTLIYFSPFLMDRMAIYNLERTSLLYSAGLNKIHNDFFIIKSYKKCEITTYLTHPRPIIREYAKFVYRIIYNSSV